MQQQFTKEYMLANRGCYDQAKMETTILKGRWEISLIEFLQTDIPLKDKYFFVCKNLATKKQNQQIAISVAEIVLPIFEKRNTEDKRPREAIQAAKEYIAGHITIETLIEKHRAAADADAAAYADADAAYADADAYAATAAAYAYAATADAYADAADADADAYAAAAAAYAAAYADAAAAAADADAAAAYADADAYAAYAAAYADAAAADAIKQQLLDYLIKVCAE